MTFGSFFLFLGILYAIYAVFQVIKHGLILTMAIATIIVAAPFRIVFEIYKFIKRLFVKEHPSMKETIRRAKEWRRSQGYDW